ncbi:MAG: fused MFS/spermidine synthase [Planctomycetaceae bacterium]
MKHTESLRSFDRTIMLSSAIALLSSFLLFHIQLQLAKGLLPLFGGGPSVWTVCSCVFQSLLLLGYVYAYLLTKNMTLRAQFYVHSAMLCISLLFLPVSLPELQELNLSPELSIAWILFLAAGVPLCLLASTSTLIQYWSFCTTPQRSPYPLFAISNLGSFLALGAYPFLIEPALTGEEQLTIWSVAYFVYCLAIGFRAAAVGLRSDRLSAQDFTVTSQRLWRPRKSSGKKQNKTPSVDKMLWFLVPFSTSTLLLAVTNYLTVDIAPVPLLWVLPLAVYLLTFVVAFSGPLMYVREICGPVIAITALFFIWILTEANSLSPAVQVVGMLSVLAVACHVCHCELVLSRPDGSRLGEFNLLIAFGGFGGALCCAFLFPAIFDDYWELQLGVLACISMTGLAFLRSRFWQAVKLVKVVPVAVYATHYLVLVSVLDISQDSEDIGVGLFLFSYLLVLLCITHVTALKPDGSIFSKGHLALVLCVQLIGLWACLMAFVPQSFSPLLLICTLVLSLGSGLSCLFLCRIAQHQQLSPPWFLAAGVALLAVLANVSTKLGATRYAVAALSCSLIMAAIAGWVVKIVTRANGSRSGLAASSSIALSGILVAVAICLGADTQTSSEAEQTVHSSRDFFGTLKVVDATGPDGNAVVRQLMHGRIVHGAQLLSKEKSRIATTYYSPSSGIAQAINITRERKAAASQTSLRVGVVGLGAGTLAAYGKAGDAFSFFEINQAVVELARTKFRFIRESLATCSFSIGDARKLLDEQFRDQGNLNFDILAIDAFSSDAIPVHLLTVECGRIFKSHLASDGILAYHISNKYLDLTPVVRGVAEDLNYSYLFVTSPRGDSPAAFASFWVLLFRNDSLKN